MEQETQNTPIVEQAPVQSEPINTNQTKMAMTDFNGLFSNAWNNYKTNFKNSLKVLIVGLILSFFVFGVAVATFFAALAMASITVSWTGIASVFIFGIVACLIFAIGIYLSLISWIALYQVVGESVPASMGLRERFRTARTKVHPTIHASFISLLIMFGGIVLFIIPGFWVALPLSFLLFSVIFENKNTDEALAQNFSIIKGRWWSVFGKFILLQILMFIIVWPLSFIERKAHLENVLVNVFSILFIPLSLSFKINVWNDLKRVHTGSIEKASVFVRALMIAGAIVVGGMIIALCLHSGDLFK